MTEQTTDTTTRCDEVGFPSATAWPTYCCRPAGHAGNHMRKDTVPADMRNAHPRTLAWIERNSDQAKAQLARPRRWLNK